MLMLSDDGFAAILRALAVVLVVELVDDVVVLGTPVEVDVDELVVRGAELDDTVVVRAELLDDDELLEWPGPSGFA